MPSKKPKQPTLVLFRRYRDGDVIALFPDIPFDDAGHVSSYSHIGQHSAANYEGVITDTLPAREHEYRHLLKELKKVGYKNLEIQEVPPFLKQGSLFKDQPDVRSP
jgi:hypothetical protein